jgi:hypothetical protein
MAACLDTCLTFPAIGQDGDTAGDTVQCRTTYLLVGARDALAYCLEASATRTTTCL